MMAAQAPMGAQQAIPNIQIPLAAHQSLMSQGFTPMGQAHNVENTDFNGII